MLNLDEYLAMADDATTPAPPLHGARPPNVEIAHEKVEHRLMAYMKANGHSNREVAQKLNYSDAQVSQITRQTWFLKLVIEELRRQADFSIDKMIANQAEASLMKVIELREHAKSEQVQLASAQSILDRFLGKPLQRVETTKGVADKVAEIEELDQEIEKVECDLRKLN